MEMDILAVQYEIKTYSQGSFYGDREDYKKNSRKLKAYFSTPQNGCLL